MRSLSSQGQTAERVLIHVDTEQAPGELVNSRMAYVSVSRAQFDVQMYTKRRESPGIRVEPRCVAPDRNPARASSTENRAAIGGHGRFPGAERGINETLPSVVMPFAGRWPPTTYPGVGLRSGAGSRH